MGLSAADANVGFTLPQEARGRLIRALDGFAAAWPNGFAFLIDTAGRLVEIARRPPGVKVEDVAALAAACFASTQRLAGAVGEPHFALVFDHEDARQVSVWPFGERALLVVVLKTGAAVEDVERQVNGPLGGELDQVLNLAREPIRAVPPPRIEPAEVPDDLASTLKALNELVMQIQGAHPKSFTPEVSGRLLKDREDLARAMSRQDWSAAKSAIATMRGWLAGVQGR